MGVSGLWDLASPAGQRVNLSALENKVVAVDASIWLYHFVKAMRDEHGNMVKGAHVLGFFRRICKLLYLKIRPVFVFDGPPPPLKRQTLRLRAQQRDTEERQRRKAVEKLLRNQLQMHILQATADAAAAGAAGAGGQEEEGREDATEAEAGAAEAEAAATEAEAGAAEASDASSAAEVVPEAAPMRRRPGRRRGQVPEAFRGFMARRRGVAEVTLPELPSEPLRDILQVPDRRGRSGRMREPDEWKGYVLPGGGVVTVPLDGPVALEEFEQLPPKIKYTLLQRAQEAWYGETRLKAVQAKDDVGAFVNVQLETFLRHVRTNKELEKVKKAMAEEVAQPGGGSVAEGDVYTPPSWLLPGAAPEGSGGGSLPAAAAAGRGEPCGRGRGRRRGLRQLDGSEPLRLGLVSGELLLDDLGQAPARRDASPPGGATAPAAAGWRSEGNGGRTRSPSASPRGRRVADSPGKTSAMDLFGAAFFQDEEDEEKAANDTAGRGRLEAAPARISAEDGKDSEDEFSGLEWCDASEALPDGMTLPPSAQGAALSTQPVTTPTVVGGIAAAVAQGFSDGASTAAHCADNASLAALPNQREMADPWMERVVPAASSSRKSEVEQAAVGVAATALPVSVSWQAEARQAAPGMDASALRASGAPAIVDDDSMSEQLEDLTDFCGHTSADVDVLGEGCDAALPTAQQVVVSIGEEQSVDSGAAGASATSAMPSRPMSAQQSEHSEHAAAAASAVSAMPSGPMSAQQSEEEAHQQLAMAEATSLADDDLLDGRSSGVSASAAGGPSTGAPGGAEGVAGEPRAEAQPVDRGSVETGAAPADAAAAAVAAAAAAPAPPPSRSGPSSSSDAMGPLDSVWCTTHFQYRWRCRHDGVEGECAALGSGASGGASSSSRPPGGKAGGKGGRGAASSNQADVDRGDLADEEMEDLEFQRMEAELQDERQELLGEMHRAKRNTDTVTPEMQSDIEALLESFGIPFVHAPAEAEAQCAFLAEARLVDAVASDDSDTLVFGGREVYRRLFAEDHMVECYTIARLQAKLGLSQGDLIVLAMLLGCDYTVGVHGIGIVNGLEIVRAFAQRREDPLVAQGDPADDFWLDALRQFRTWAQNVAEWGTESAGISAEDRRSVAEFKKTHRNFRTQWSFPEDFPNPQVHAAFVQPVVDRSLEPFSWAPVDVASVVGRLVLASGLDEAKLMERLEPALRRYTDGMRQPRITEYMVPEEAGDVARVRSVRMRQALRGLRGEASPERSPTPPPRAPRRRRAAAAVGEGGEGAAAGPRRRQAQGSGSGEGAKASKRRKAQPPAPASGWTLRQGNARIELDD